MFSSVCLFIVYDNRCNCFPITLITNKQTLPRYCFGSVCLLSRLWENDYSYCYEAGRQFLSIGWHNNLLAVYITVYNYWPVKADTLISDWDQIHSSCDHQPSVDTSSTVVYGKSIKLQLVLINRKLRTLLRTFIANFTGLSMALKIYRWENPAL